MQWVEYTNKNYADDLAKEINDAHAKEGSVLPKTAVFEWGKKFYVQIAPECVTHLSSSQKEKLVDKKYIDAVHQAVLESEGLT